VIEARGLTKLYSNVEALVELSFSVGPGEILGLVGPNGAGKTTTLRLLSGILPPTSGEVRIGDRSLSDDPVGSKERLAYVPDEPRPFESLTVYEHLRFTALAYRVDAWEERAEGLLRRFALDSKRFALGSELSRGMRQKLAISCAYLHEPSAILLDEPLSGLDPRGVRQMKDSILDEARRGAAIVISSHLLEFIEGLCSHVLVLHKGRKILAGTLEEIRVAAGALRGDESLEEIFLRATYEPEEAPAPEAGT
jgi:ABC-2 type transport system ATP-binding protein